MNLTLMCFIQTGASRPSGDPFDTMSLSHFAVWYGISNTSIDEVTSSRAQPTLEQYGMYIFTT